MPEYQFSNPKKPSEVVTIFQSMNETHEYIKNGVKWDRVWSVPQMAVNTVYDPYSSADFIKKTSNGGTVGDLFDLSAEMSAKRKEKDGVDFIEEKTKRDTAAKDKKIQAKNARARASQIAKKSVI